MEHHVESVELGGAGITMQPLVSLGVNDADVPAVAVEIGSGVEFVLSLVELHHVPPWID